jgi:hypothetical protein
MKSFSAICTAALAAVFAIEARSLAAQEQESRPLPPQTKHTFWQHTGSGMIIDAWKCATSKGEPNVCLKVHAVDPATPGMKGLAAELLDKKHVSDQEVFRLCGFNPRFEKMRQQRPASDSDFGQWKGTIKVPLDSLRGQGKDETGANAEIEQQGNGSLRLHIWATFARFTVFNRTMNFTPVENPPPACISPSP